MLIETMLRDPSTRRAVAFATGLLMLTGCGMADAPPATATVSDSAGVRVVTHQAVDAPLFELGTAPRYQLRGDEGGGLPLFSVVGGLITEDGAVVVADGGNYRLVRWTADGEPLGAVGGQGSGPGEFQAVAWFHATGDEIAVFDARASRISWFSATGPFLRSRQMERQRPPPSSDDAIQASGNPMGIVGDGGVLTYPVAHADPDQQAGPLPLWADLHVADSAGAVLHEVGRIMLIEWYEDPEIEGFPLANRMETPRLYYAGRGDLIAITDAMGHRVDVLERGSRATIIREDRPRLPFSPDSIPSEYHLAADSLQAYRDVRIDGLRRVWVKPAVSEGTADTRWRIFSAAGDRLGDLILPTDAIVLDASPDRLLLLRKSDLDEESVEVWDLGDAPS